MFEQIITPFCALWILILPSSILGGQPTSPSAVHPPPPSLPVPPQSAPNLYTFQQFLTEDEQTFDVNSTNKVYFQVQRAYQRTTPKNFLSVYIQSREGQNITIEERSADTLCWFSKTYKSSDGVKFHLSNRIIGADRWVIKKGGPIKEDYTWHRTKSTLDGNLTTKNGTVVASIQNLWSHLNGFYDGWPYYIETAKGSINSTGVVPTIYLLGLYETAFARMLVCGT